MRRLKTTQLKGVRDDLTHKQGGKCAICGITFKKPADACLDHCHTRGHIRDVLCRNCNGIEGKIHNLVRRGMRGNGLYWFVKKLVLYWMRHETPQHDLFHPTFKTADEKRLRNNAKARAKRAADKG